MFLIKKQFCIFTEVLVVPWSIPLLKVIEPHTNTKCTLLYGNFKKLTQLKEVKSCNLLVQNLQLRDFPGDPVVKNLPADAGDTGSLPAPGRSHTLWSNQACEPELLSLCSRAHAPQQEKSQQQEVCAPHARE